MYEKFTALFIRAAEKGFISDLLNNAECNSKCEKCPAKEACREMSKEENGYEGFRATYRAEILPRLKNES